MEKHALVMRAFKEAREGLIANSANEEIRRARGNVYGELAWWKIPRRVDEYTNGSTEGITRLRLDFELPYDLDDPLSDKQMLNIMFWDFGTAYTDILDLLTNGDVRMGHEALLKAMDGEKVRGKTLAKVELAEVVVYKEIKPRKEAIELTAYILLYTEWEDKE